MSGAHALRVLIVEDEPLLAWQLGAHLHDGGHTVTGVAASAAQAVELALHTRPDLTLVDVRLADGATGVTVARRLHAAGILALFVSASLKRLPADLAGAVGALPKPHTVRDLLAAVDYAARLLHGGDRPDAPAGLHLPARGHGSRPQPGIREPGCAVPASSLSSVLSPSAG